MFDRLSEGLLGLFIFLSNWFSPANSSEEIRIAAAKEFSLGYSIECAIKLDWNEQMSDLVDAGIPLRLKITSYSDRGDSLYILRTLLCDIGDYTYTFCDSLGTPLTDSVFTSRKFSQIYRAVREYSRWQYHLSKEATQFYMEAELLPSWVSQLDRNLDMSAIVGCRKFSRTFQRKE